MPLQKGYITPAGHVAQLTTLNSGAAAARKFTVAGTTGQLDVYWHKDAGDIVYFWLDFEGGVGDIASADGFFAPGVEKALNVSGKTYVCFYAADVADDALKLTASEVS